MPAKAVTMAISSPAMAAMHCAKSKMATVVAWRLGSVQWAIALVKAESAIPPVARLEFAQHHKPAATTLWNLAKAVTTAPVSLAMAVMQLVKSKTARPVALGSTASTARHRANQVSAMLLATQRQASARPPLFAATACLKRMKVATTATW